MSLRIVSYLALFSLVTVLASCSSAPKPVKSADQYYQEAEAAYARRNYEEAVTAYKKVKEAYSSPELTAKAELKIADAHYANESYIEAAAAYEDFRKLHPTNPKAPYALYRAALSHYHQITGIDTDQTPVKNAVITLESFLRQYPDSEYAPEVREKLADCRNKQLEYETYVGNFYLRTGKNAAGIKRLSDAVQHFPKSLKLDRTLYLLGKGYLDEGNREKADLVFSQLATQFPNSEYHKEAVKTAAKFASYTSHGK
ncbi:outer membrane protein assembly factor BamD [Geomonas sp. Red276]